MGAADLKTCPRCGRTHLEGTMCPVCYGAAPAEARRRAEYEQFMLEDKARHDESMALAQQSLEQTARLIESLDDANRGLIFHAGKLGEQIDALREQISANTEELQRVRHLIEERVNG